MAQEVIIIEQATAKQLGAALLTQVADLKALCKKAEAEENHSMMNLWRGRLAQAERALADYQTAYCDSRNNTMTKRG